MLKSGTAALSAAALVGGLAAGSTAAETEPAAPHEVLLVATGDPDSTFAFERPS